MEFIKGRIEQVRITDLKLNNKNPRIIKDHKFRKLVQSIKEFPKMLELRPIIVDNDLVILGGNMRFRACLDAGLDHVPVMKASDLTEEEKKQFIIKDNVSFGDWDWDLLANDFNTEELSDWGLDIAFPGEDELLEMGDYEDEDGREQKEKEPSRSDDDYSAFEIIMLHENKLQLIETLNKIKNNMLFEKQEEALMELIRIYNKHNGQ